MDYLCCLWLNSAFSLSKKRSKKSNLSLYRAHPIPRFLIIIGPVGNYEIIGSFINMICKIPSKILLIGF